ncbi:NTP transferase domain-containing protein [Peteryoungia desertarenae]|uniref:NTP transferase domain-containing protein n=1 Tax=Peteryoungia desertarenae TaxID=1813451 RepID=A0ABX6QPW7_9HYPH|nr:molybdopterin-binding/glycosyltransferase family 2 protein [Peteryoungia desertarenae]QLF70654.1 NTP transferase domain-containing protein [Peteryoungia desertarenae]
MKFGSFALTDACGVILAHSIQAGETRVGKGKVLGPSDIELLAHHGVSDVIGCRLDGDDLGEDDAAHRLAEAITMSGMRRTPATTGRVNFYATTNGLFRAHRVLVDAFNRVDPAITLACLADYSDVREGDLIATIKIIPLGVSERSVDEARIVLESAIAFELLPYSAHDVHLVATMLPSLKPSVMDKTVQITGRRLAASGSVLASEQRVAHRAEAVAEALQSALVAQGNRPRLLLVFGASAVCDPNDVIPEAIRLAGGVVDQVGLPVDPGNLLVLGHIDDVAVIGAPGCARSPKENGFDWVLRRLLAGETPTAHDLSGLGVGGLLMEIPSRPLPRAVATGAMRKEQIALVVLAAGRASRMGIEDRHKLLAEFDGEPLVRRVVRQASEADLGPVIVVTGHRSKDVGAALDGLSVRLVNNPDYPSGMASSLKSGLASLDEGCGAMMVLLADMPNVLAEDIKKLAEAFKLHQGRAVIRAVADGQRGNPVILPRSTFEALRMIEGDIGARPIIESSGLPVVDIEIGAAARLDVDTPEAVIAAGGVLKD